MRIFIGSKEVAGIFTFLYLGFKELGIDTSIFLPEQHIYKYQDVQKSQIEKILSQIYRHIYQKRKLKIVRVIGYSIYSFIKFWIHLFYFPYILFRYDVFIFSSGETFFWGYDLPIFRFFGKKVIAVFTGSDTRPVYINPYLHGTSPRILVQKAKWQKRLLQKLERNNVICINNPPTAIFHSKPYIKWLKIGIPVKRESGKKVAVTRLETVPQRVVEILHSPSNTGIKGSKHILKAMKKIQAEYQDENKKELKFTLLKGVPNHKVVDYIQGSDFMIDQLFSDTPMAVFASEAAYFGKPSVVAGTYAKDILQHYKPEDIPPSLYILPEQLENAIKKIIEDDTFRLELSQAAQKFVQEKWSLTEVAKKYLRIINDDIPNDWWSDPNNDLTDMYPIGEEEVVLPIIQKIIDQYGIAALQISDKPYLEKRILERVKKFTKR